MPDAPPADDGCAAATFCATLVDEWARAGLTDAVVCPGSRSTPLALALANDGRLRLHVHHDERAAAFVALGLGTASGRPAPVVTTSGTAAVNLHPAVVEAHHGRVPMIVCTADRPPELHDVGAPQTIDQRHLYGRSVRWYWEPGVADLAARQAWRADAARTVVEAMGSDGAAPGPVHALLAFREPLVADALELPDARPDGRPWLRRPRPTEGNVDEGLVEALSDVVSGRRVLVVAGGQLDDATEVLDVAARLGWPVVADPRSGCRVPAAEVVSHADAILRSDVRALDLAPEVVLRLGTSPASKVLGRWLADLAGSGVWQAGIDRWGGLYDPERVLDCVVAAEPGALLAAVARAGTDRAPEGWLTAWAGADATAASALDRVLADHPTISEPAVARDVVAALPEGSTLVVSSSMPVRDVEWYSSPREGLRVLANRGANGIDGVVSTALGVALATGAPTVCLVGDVALLHDSTALVGAAHRDDVTLTIVVVDNDGGGIFSFLPQATAPGGAAFEELFGTPHGTDLTLLAAAHGLVTIEPFEPGELGPAVRASLAAGGVRLVRVATDRAANVEAHRRIHAAVARAVGAAV